MIGWILGTGIAFIMLLDRFFEGKKKPYVDVRATASGIAYMHTFKDTIGDDATLHPTKMNIEIECN